MPLYMYQFAYTPESWAAQVKKPQNRVETVGRAACEAAGGKLVGGWLCFGKYDAVLIADMPNMESMAAVAHFGTRPSGATRRLARSKAVDRLEEEAIRAAGVILERGRRPCPHRRTPI